MSLIALTTISFPTTAFPPLAVGFFGLGTGYVIWGPQELLGFPTRTRQVDLSNGLWGIWMPGFMQFVAGMYLFAALVIFHSIHTPALVHGGPRVHCVRRALVRPRHGTFPRGGRTAQWFHVRGVLPDRPPRNDLLLRQP